MLFSKRFRFTFPIFLGFFIIAGPAWATELVDLSVSNGGSLDSAFSPTTYAYEVTLDAGSASVDVTAAVRPRHLVSIDGSTATTRTQFSTISNLANGDTFDIVATRANGRNPDTYTLTIIVPANTAPTVTVTTAGGIIDEGDSITLSASLSDFQDTEDVLNQSLRWVSDLDGEVATGNDQAVVLASTGTHEITATVTDSGGMSAGDTVSITVNGTTFTGPPAELIGNAFSGTSIGLHWEVDAGATSYTVSRDGIEIATVANNYYTDAGLSVDTLYDYDVVVNAGGNSSAASSVSVSTLVNTTNDGTDNGAETVIVNERLTAFSECGNVRRVDLLADDQLDTCLEAMLAFNSMAGHLEDTRAFAARVRSEQDPAMVELGMRLFHSKSLSPTGDVACSSCHHPALGCGGDDLSMPVGVNPVEPELLGPGRSDGINSVPVVPRNSPATCNTSLWTQGLFWDNRVDVRSNETRTTLRTDSEEVTSLTTTAIGADDSLTLLMAQAHFPVTAAPEMADILDYGYDDALDSDHTDFREDVLAAELDTQAWGPLFGAAFGDGTINYSRIAQAMAAYEAVQIFIDNPFFAYVDGDIDALSLTEKRGAIAFMARGSGCTFCHAGAFFSTQAALPASYPQIGVGTDENGSGADNGTTTAGASDGGVFRSPTLLNVGITGPWGHNGQWGTLARNVEHYDDILASIEKYFAEQEMCDLDQFADLANCVEQVAPDGLTLSLTIFDQVNQFEARNLTEDSMSWIVEFLHTLTDPAAADSNSNAIQSLIPPRDGGPDGNQLDAYDQDGNPL
ncbi:MAG: hypothetical protein GY732_10765 [Gammaproteobacteria bacterium]|nr:hypothetical protein [Gammaproteobacteria bacterium]